MTDAQICQLDVWKGDWGLPSVDRNCLQVLTYARIAGIPLKVNTKCNPFKTPNGRLPVLRAGPAALDTIKSIVDFLREINCDKQVVVDDLGNGMLEAYSRLLEEKLYPALEFIWWVDKPNVEELVRPWYSKAISFPFKFYYPKKYEQRALSFLEALYPGENDLTVIENKVYTDAQKCLTLLSKRLGDSKFFLGEEPTMLDAIVYSYLAPLYKTPLPHPALQNYLKGCSNLVRFITSISEDYFDTKDDIGAAQEHTKVQKADGDNDFPNKLRDQILAGAFAAVAMGSYAFFNGISLVLTYVLKKRTFVKRPKKKKQQA